jgi:hypothetical protein
MLGRVSPKKSGDTTPLARAGLAGVTGLNRLFAAPVPPSLSGDKNRTCATLRTNGSPTHLIGRLQTKNS